MFELGISTIVFIVVLIVGIIMLKNVFKIIVFIVSAALIFMLVGGALVFLDVQSFSNNFFSQQSQILLLEPSEDKIISSLVIDFDNESEGNLLLQTDEMIMRADGFYSTNTLREQPGFYKHIIFKTTGMPKEYELYGVKLSIEEMIEVMKANDPIVELRRLLSGKLGEERADSIISSILREISRENKLRSYLFLEMISEMPEEFTVSYLMDSVADKNVSIVPETPVFVLARYFPRIIDWASQKIEKQFEI